MATRCPYLMSEKIRKKASSDATEVVPWTRWDVEQECMAHQMPPRFGTFLKSVEDFDTSLFGINMLEANVMDPQQRLLLEVCVRY